MGAMAQREQSVGVTQWQTEPGPGSSLVDDLGPAERAQAAVVIRAAAATADAGRNAQDYWVDVQGHGARPHAQSRKQVS